MNGPALPTFTLAAGLWRAEVFDPRPDPHALGARYVHGGYVAALYYQDRLLTDRPKPAWNPYEGQGLPEVFEYPFAYAAAEVGRPYLRIGVGRLIKEAGGPAADGPLADTVRWEVVARESGRVVMRCADELMIGDKRFAYQLEREVAVDAGGLTSRTTLTLACPWSHPVVWFAHPFFKHTAGDRTGFSLPSGACAPSAFARGADGFHRLGAAGGFGAITGVWGTREPIRVALDPAHAAPMLAMIASYPLDKLVIYGTAQAASIEPYFARAWQDGETASWTLRYAADEPSLP